MAQPVDSPPQHNPPVQGDGAVEATLQQVVRAARRSLALKRVILFGSRARGDARADSDIDLAFDHTSSDAVWAEFVNEMQERAPTLLALDLVDWNSADAALRARIQQEGRVLGG